MRASETNPPTEPVDPNYHALTFTASSPLEHDQVLYAAGAQVDGALFTPEQFNLLRRLGVLKYASEVARAEELAAQAAERDAALTAARGEIEQLRAQIEQLRSAPGARRASGTTAIPPAPVVPSDVGASAE